MMNLYFTLGMTCSSIYMLAYIINITFYRFSDHKLLNGIIGETEDEEDLLFGTMLTVLMAILIGIIAPIIIFAVCISILVWFIRRLKDEKKEHEQPERGLRIIKN